MVSTNLHLLIKPYGKTRTKEYNTGTVIERMIMRIMKLKEKTILKKLKNGKALGEDKIPSELHKYT